MFIGGGKVAELEKGRLYISKENARQYCSKMEKHYFLGRTEETRIPKNVYFVSIYKEVCSSGEAFSPIVYLGKTH